MNVMARKLQNKKTAAMGDRSKVTDALAQYKSTGSEADRNAVFQALYSGMDNGADWASNLVGSGDISGYEGLSSRLNQLFAVQDAAQNARLSAARSGDSAGWARAQSYVSQPWTAPADYTEQQQALQQTQDSGSKGKMKMQSDPASHH